MKYILVFLVLISGFSGADSLFSGTGVITLPSKKPTEFSMKLSIEMMTGVVSGEYQYKTSKKPIKLEGKKEDGLLILAAPEFNEEMRLTYKSLNGELYELNGQWFSGNLAGQLFAKDQKEISLLSCNMNLPQSAITDCFEHNYYFTKKAEEASFSEILKSIKNEQGNDSVNFVKQVEVRWVEYAEAHCHAIVLGGGSMGRQFTYQCLIAEYNRRLQELTSYVDCCSY